MAFAVTSALGARIFYVSRLRSSPRRYPGALAPPKRLLTRRFARRLSTTKRGPATRRSGACRDGTSTRKPDPASWAHHAATLKERKFCLTPLPRRRSQPRQQSSWPQRPQPRAAKQVPLGGSIPEGCHGTGPVSTACGRAVPHRHPSDAAGAPTTLTSPTQPGRTGRLRGRWQHHHQPAEQYVAEFR
jgi:hypothetical protein